MPVTCFFLEPIRQARLTLRRYNYNLEGDKPCPLMPGEGSYHNAHAPLFDVSETYEYEAEFQSKIYRYEGPHEKCEVPSTYPWPEACACGYKFEEPDQWQVSSESLYRRSDTGEILTLKAAGPGAMWNAEYLQDNPSMTGADGLSLMVKCPNGVEWAIDGACRNCTMPEDTVHKCWCRSGVPPVITVSKDGCVTCNAGGGSIVAGDYHGFLRAGVFEP